MLFLSSCGSWLLLSTILPPLFIHLRSPKEDRKIAWIKLIEKDLKDLKRFVQKEEDLEEIALNRERWRKLIHCGLLDLSDGNRN